MELLRVASDRIVVTFEEQPFGILDIQNTLTGRAICQRGTQAILIRTPRDVSEPIFLHRIQSVARDHGGIHFIIADAAGKCRAKVSIAHSDDGIRFQVRVTASQPIWLMEWQISGLQLDAVIVPALGGQVLSEDMPVDVTASYKYPFWWNAQFVVGSHHDGGIWLRSKDAAPNLKLLRVRKGGDGFALTYGVEVAGPLRSKTLEAVWYLDCYQGDWKVPVDIHRRWLEQAFHLLPISRNRHFPSWAGKINFVLELWGMRKDQSNPHHTFDEMIGRLSEWAKKHSPERTLVYLPGYSGHGIDSKAPDYSPSEHLGGGKKFHQLVRFARNLGYRVMIHTNVLAATFNHPLYAKLKRYQVVDVFERPQGWGLDIDGDWLAEPYFAYINPGYKAWGDLMEEVLGELITGYDLDAVFLDQTLLAFNVHKGPNFLTGMGNHIRRLQKTFPDILFAGEGLHEHVVNALPMAQIHGVDSIAEVHGIEGKKPWRAVHPVSTYLFGKYTRFVAHLLTRHPSNPMFAAQEDAYAKLGVIPALCLYDHSQSMDGHEVERMVRRANELEFMDTP